MSAFCLLPWRRAALLACIAMLSGAAMAADKPPADKPPIPASKPMQQVPVQHAAVTPPPAPQAAAAPVAAPVAPSAAASRPDLPQKGTDSGLPVPRFVSLAADKVNARTGPGSRYPIAWQYQRRGLPVEVVGEYEYWRRIRDRDGTETWVHKNLTSGKRYALVDGTIRELFKKPDPNSDVLLTAEPGVQARLRKCQDSWCQVEIAGARGWIPRNHLWGIYASESFE